MLLTAYDGAILGPIARLLGWVMNGVYLAVYKVFGIESVVLSIVLITIIIYMCMLPLTIKQQKFSKLSQAMQPELQAVQAKYKNRKDTESVQMMNQETQLVYQKYGVSPMGSCVQMLIQMPILFALYRVFYNVPAYITSVKDTFSGLVDGVVATEGYQEILQQLMTDHRIITGSNLNSNNVLDKFAAVADNSDAVKNYVVDILYKIPSTVWGGLNETFTNLGDQISQTWDHVQKFNYFIGMNISDTPMSIIRNGWSDKAYFMCFAALMIPVLSYLTQVLSIKLMPTPENNSKGGNAQQDAMSQQMKTMNTMMPLMSLVLCFSVPVGLGIYWIMSAVVRVVQMYFINRHIQNLNLDDIIAKNEEKARIAREKAGIAQNQIREAAKMRTKQIESKANVAVSQDREAALEAANQKKANAKAGSMAAKANMVRDFNERNTRK